MISASSISASGNKCSDIFITTSQNDNCHCLKQVILQISLLYSEDMKAQPSLPKIVVVGAGLSGLTAARQLLKHFKCELTVLQANDYVGGRTKTQVVNGVSFDLGAQFIGPTQSHAIELALQSKNELVPVSDQGHKILHLKEGRYTYEGQIPKIGNIFPLIEMQFTLMKLNRMAKKVPVNPSECQMAQKWDAMTVQSWIEQNLSSLKTKVMVEGALRVILGTQLSQISFLYFLSYIRSSRDFENLITIKNGLQEKKTSKGTQHMSIFLSEQIQKLGGQLKLNYFVKSIEQTDKKIIVTSSSGDKVQGQYLIMAMPPPNVSKISFTPALSVQRRMICQRTFMGTISKIMVLYPEPFWKHKGFSGEVLSDCYDGPAMNVYDDTRTNHEGKIQPALLVFIGGSVYNYWKDRNDLEKKMVIKLAEFFKEPKLLHPTQVIHHQWEEQTSMGGPVANFPPGVLSFVDDLRKPEGLIHWAGTEMARESAGFMDGAIESGKRVAQQIIKRHEEGRPSSPQNQEKLFQMPPAYTKANRPPKMPLLTSFFQWW